MFDASGMVVPARTAVSPAPGARRKKRTAKTKGASDGPLLIAPSPSVSPAPGSPDLAAPVPVAATTQPLRRTHSLGRFGRDSLGASMLGGCGVGSISSSTADAAAAAAALGASIVRAPSTPHTSLTPALGAMGLATTPTKKRTRAPYRTNVSPALLAQNPTSATLAAAVAASASTANLDRCAPALGDRKFAGYGANYLGSATKSTCFRQQQPQQPPLPSAAQQAQAQAQAQLQQQQQQHYFGLGGAGVRGTPQLQAQQQGLRPAKSMPVQQMINAQKKQIAQQQLQHHLGHARGAAPFGGSAASLASLQQQLAQQQGLRPGARLLAGTPQPGPGHFVRPVSPKRK